MSSHVILYGGRTYTIQIQSVIPVTSMRAEPQTRAAMQFPRFHTVVKCLWATELNRILTCNTQIPCILI